METRVALVTGGNRGIGLEICRQLAKQNIHVLLGARDARKGREAAQGIPNSEALELDAANPASIRAAVDFAERAHGRLDILINNAGIFIDKGIPGFELGLEILEETMRTNAYGPLLLSQAALPLMRKQGYGRIVNLSSGLGQLNGMGGAYLAYRTSKAALNAITRVLAAELAGSNIKINTMCPGWVRTEMGGKNATREVEEGADTAVWLATLPDDGPTGGFFRDHKPIDW